jgi:undecaprenyl diphosphate synthase
MPPATPEEIASARASLGVPDERIPRSVAIIMDGNGRWARQRNFPRPVGHSEGAKAVRRIVTEAARLGLDALTLYSFSLENWSRPRDEINALMHLYAEYLVEERPTVMANNIRLRHVGRRDGLPEPVLRELDESVRVSSKNTGMWLCLALNYGSRAEILDAVRTLAKRARTGCLEPENIDEQGFSDALDSHGVPDPDLLIRTAGEMRISNFLLWQISYAEFYVTETHWPDFDEAELHKACIAYANRQRRFGGVDDSNA